MRNAFDPIVIQLIEATVNRRDAEPTVSFGRSLDGTRDILIASASELTDLLGIVPAAKALRRRYPLSRVHVLASGLCIDALAAREEVAEVIPWDDTAPLASRATWDLVRRIRSRSFDMAIATTCATPLPRLWVGLAEAKLRVGPSTSGSDRLLNLVIQSAPARDGAAAGLSFLSFLGIDPKELTPGWDVTQADRDYARRLLNLRRRGNDGWLLGVDPARGRDGQRPAPDRLAWVVDRIVEHRGAAPILVTAEATNGCIEEFRRCLKSDPMVVPTRGLRDALALARVCRMFVGPDTDLFRFARALHVPSLGLFQTPTAADADARCEVVEWRSGDRVRETDVLNRVDRLLRRSVVELPLRLLLGGDGSAASECVQRA